MYSLNYQVTTSTCDSEGRLKLYSALQMMQDCSEMWIDSEPGVKQYFKEQNMAQLLASRQVEIIRVPVFKEKLTVTTSVYGMKPMFGFRNTYIYDAEGKPCYRTWSMGAFVDKATGKLKRVDNDTIATMTLESQLEMNYKDRRIILPKEDGITCAPYYLGQGVELDHAKAFLWYREAAFQGHVLSQKNVGAAYWNGDGVEKNLEECAFWYELAAHGGDAQAQFAIGWFHMTGNGVPDTR